MYSVPEVRKDGRYFEIQFVGYGHFKDEKDALKFAYKMEEVLGYLTRNDINLYCSDVKDMLNKSK